MNPQKNEALKKTYLNEVRSLFPILRKEEKVFLQKMEANVDDFLENEEAPSDLGSMEGFYKTFGEPKDVVYQYYSALDLEPLFSAVRMRRFLKILLLSLLGLVSAVSIFICILLYQEHLSFMRSEPVFITTEIIEYPEVTLPPLP